MSRTRRIWWKAAGLVMAATAASPALAQSLPGAGEVMALPDDAPARTTETLPPPRPAATAPTVRPLAVIPAASSCGAECATGRSRWSWQGWRAEKHAQCQAHFWGYPAEFEAPPLGATIHGHFQTMVANGEAASMVLYRCDFKEGSNELNLRGRDQLTKMAGLVGVNNFPIVIERTPEAPALAEARRTAILNVLAMNSIVLPPERVRIGVPIAHGLAGSDAQVLYPYQLRNMQYQALPLPFLSGGAGLGTTGGTGTGTGTGAGGAGGVGLPR